MDFKRFKPILEKAAGRPRSPKGGRPSFDPILKFKMPALQSLRGLSLEATEKMVRDRPGWMRFCGEFGMTRLLQCIHKTTTRLSGRLAEGRQNETYWFQSERQREGHV